MLKQHPLDRLKHNTKLEIPKLGGCAATIHSFSKREIWAVIAAVHASRPLLLRGEPGTGKTQLAQAVAHVLGRNLITTVVQSRTEAQELLWQVDPVERLSMAHLVSETENDANEKLNPKHFLTPGPLWYAIDWASAVKHRCKYPAWVPPSPPIAWQPNDGVVMLIDEIDKAEPELANALLEVFGQRAFRVPCLPEEIRATEKDPKPLVIITTNEERELPPAFLRRCLVLQLGLPNSDEKLIAHLTKRGELHSPELDITIREAAAKQLVYDRNEAKKTRQPRPGQAEYLDLLCVLNELQQQGENPAEWLDRISPYTFQKGSEAQKIQDDI